MLFCFVLFVFCPRYLTRYLLSFVQLINFENYFLQERYIDSLAAKYKGEKDIIIAKMDGTTNEAPSQYEFTGFPTIYYALPGKKTEPILLDGKRDMDALIEFVENNSIVLKKKKQDAKEEL